MSRTLRSSSLEAFIKSIIIILKQSFLNREIGTFMSYVNTIEMKRGSNKDIKICIDCLFTGILHTFQSLLSIELQNKRFFRPIFTFAH